MKVLIAEDDAAINDLIRMNLSDAGFTCIGAHDGMVAADLLEQESFWKYRYAFFAENLSLYCGGCGAFLRYRWILAYLLEFHSRQR